MMQAGCVEVGNLVAVWPAVRRYINDALEHDRGAMTEAEILAACLTKRMVLMMVADEQRIYAAQTAEVIFSSSLTM